MVEKFKANPSDSKNHTKIDGGIKPSFIVNLTLNKYHISMMGSGYGFKNVKLKHYKAFYGLTSKSGKECYEQFMEIYNQHIHPTFESGYSYHAVHLPTGEKWHIIGINKDLNKVCVAGYPPTEANLSDCYCFEKFDSLTDQELAYRLKKFGTNWL